MPAVFAPSKTVMIFVLGAKNAGSLRTYGTIFAKEGPKTAEKCEDCRLSHILGAKSGAKNAMCLRQS